MITKISSLSFCGAQKKTNTFAQNSKPKVNYNACSNYNDCYKQQQRSALGLSLTTIFGAMLFLFGYFIFTGLKNGKIA